MVAKPPLLLQVWSAPRTTQPGYPGCPHARHPPGHAPDCEIDKPGTVTTPLQQLDQHVFNDATFSCAEPADTWPALLEALDVPMPRRRNRRGR